MYKELDTFQNFLHSTIFRTPDTFPSLQTWQYSMHDAILVLGYWPIRHGMMCHKMNLYSFLEEEVYQDTSGLLKSRYNNNYLLPMLIIYWSQPLTAQAKKTWHHKHPWIDSHATIWSQIRIQKKKLLRSKGFIWEMLTPCFMLWSWIDLEHSTYLRPALLIY